jgi:AAA+ ATPase superfamily predicted ATPase
MISISHPATGPDFVNRRTLLKQLHSAYPHQNVVLVGPRRIGKSSIAEEFLRTLTIENTVKVIFDVQGNMGTPGKFAVRLLHAFLKAYLQQIRNMYNTELDNLELKPAILVGVAEEIGSKVLSDLSKFLISYFPPSPDEERPVLERVLKFLDAFSTEMGVTAAIVLDEFQAIMELGSYKGLESDYSVRPGKIRGSSRGKLLGLLQNIISSQKSVWYLFTGSSVRMMIDILESDDSPFYGRVARLNVKPFPKEDSYELVQRCTSKVVAGEALSSLFNLSNGHPFYLVALAIAADRLSGVTPIISKQEVEEAFTEELTRGTLYSHCRYLFETSLGRVRKVALLKEVLRELSAGDLSLTELARKMKRSTGYLTTPLSVLYNLDLIERRDKRYLISDPVLQIWLNSVHGQNEPRLDAIRKKISQSYQEHIASIKTELGIYFESYLREMLRKFDGHRFKERCLPKFDTVDSINDYDEAGVVFGKPSNIEIDALCLGEENWICEFKHRSKMVTKKEIEALVRKRDFFQTKTKLRIHQLMCVAQSGFSKEALQSDVWCMAFRELDQLLSMLSMRKTGDILKEMK